MGVIEGQAYRTTAPGYPRLGEGRVYKRLLEGFWNGSLSHDTFSEEITDLRAGQMRKQAEGGLDWIPCGDFSLYDHVLDAAVMLGCIPERFGWDGGAVGLDLYFAMARGQDGIPPCEMTKWFDTNYHYLVPELPETFTFTSNWPLDALRFGRKVVGESAKPVLLGPYTFLKLAHESGESLVRLLNELTPIYERILGELAAENAPLVQVDEPSLVGDVSPEEWAEVETLYRTLGQAAPIMLQTYYGDVEPVYESLVKLPVSAIGLDFVRGKTGNLQALAAHGFPADKVLVAGVVDGRNVWRTDLDTAFNLINGLTKTVAPDRIVLSSSCTLLHLPESVESETMLDAGLSGGLCFAKERLGELRLLAAALRGGKDSVRDAWAEAETLRQRWAELSHRHRPDVHDRTNALTDADFTRMAYPERRIMQRAALNLPPLPTTTIGSFPQTPELRRARAAQTKDPEGYRRVVREEIEKVVRLQEEIGLDVLVHGEPERNDMVQFFAEQMHGFAATQEGWVQSYGSRCVRPPLLYGDIDRARPMTVELSEYAQSLTDKPMKGMLTGPVTMIQWSFVREDIPRSEVAMQIGLAIRDESRELEAAGLKAIQIDEAAFREGLPLRRAEWDAYLEWAVRSFRLASAGVKPETQIHTHMCYSEFKDILASIAALDADVLSIEDARSYGEMLDALREFRYPAEIGPGVYDIHSPNVPDVERIVAKLRETLERLQVEQVWVNPDCGLKTRRYEEVVPALRNMVAAALTVRDELASG